MSFILLVASFSTSCVNYGAFQGITSDGLYIGPLPIQSRWWSPDFSLTDTSSIWHDNYFSYVGRIYFGGVITGEVEDLALEGLGMDIIEIDQMGLMAVDQH